MGIAVCMVKYEIPSRVCVKKKLYMLDARKKKSLHLHVCHLFLKTCVPHSCLFSFLLRPQHMRCGGGDSLWLAERGEARMRSTWAEQWRQDGVLRGDPHSTEHATEVVF